MGIQKKEKSLRIEIEGHPVLLVAVPGVAIQP